MLNGYGKNKNGNENDFQRWIVERRQQWLFLEQKLGRLTC